MVNNSFAGCTLARRMHNVPTLTLVLPSNTSVRFQAQGHVPIDCLNKNIINPKRLMKANLLQSILPFLLSSRSHLGQRAQPLWSKKGIDPSSVFSVLGKREKLFLTNPLVTLKGLLRALRAVQTVSNYNGSILIVNTNPSLSLLCERFSFFSSLNKLGFGAEEDKRKKRDLRAKQVDPSHGHGHGHVGNVGLIGDRDPSHGRLASHVGHVGHAANLCKASTNLNQTGNVMANSCRFLVRNKTASNNYKLPVKSNGLLSLENEKSIDFSGKIFFCNEKWTGGLLSNWKKVSNSVETFDTFSKAFGPFLRENKIQFSTYKEMKKRYNGLLEFQLRKLKEESLFLGAHGKQVQSKYLLNGSHNTTNKEGMVVQSKVFATSWLGKKKEQVDKKNSNECATTTTCKAISKAISERRKSPTRIGTGKFNEKPDLIFLINCNENAHVLQEAASLKIPVIGITNTSTHQTGITYPIPGNSESAEFVFFCLKWVSAVSTAPSVFSL